MIKRPPPKQTPTPSRFPYPQTHPIPLNSQKLGKHSENFSLKARFELLQFYQLKNFLQSAKQWGRAVSTSCGRIVRGGPETLEDSAVAEERTKDLRRTDSVGLRLGSVCVSTWVWCISMTRADSIQVQLPNHNPSPDTSRDIIKILSNAQFST